MPKISVICPVYNTERYLCRCIDTVLNQTFTDFELILVDDSSTDTSGEICRRYVQRDMRIKYVALKKNAGVANARNVGLKNALGEYIAWIDSDDWVDVDWLETMYDLLIEYSAEIAIIGTKNVYEKILQKEKSVDNKIVILNTEGALQELVNDSYIANGLMDKLFSKQLYQNLMFPLGRSCQDAALMHILLSRANAIVVSSLKKYNYFFRLGSLSHKYSIQYEYDRFLAHKDRLNFFMNTGRSELFAKEAKIIFLDALKVQEMGLFRKNSLTEVEIIKIVFNWSQSFLESERNNLSEDIIRRFNLIYGTKINRIYIFVKYELKYRLQFFLLTHSPDSFVVAVRKLKRAFSI
jgi:glycosyltransferase involved in cell wall biosynthesis